MAVVTNSLSPRMTGLEWLSPGIGVFHLILRTGAVLASPFQLAGAAPCPTPLAPGPRYPGQSAADRTGRTQTAITTNLRASIDPIQLMTKDRRNRMPFGIAVNLS